MGIDSIKIACLDDMSDFFIRFPTTEIETMNEVLYQVAGNPYAKRVDAIKTMYERIMEGIQSTLKNGEFPVVLSGDHSNAGGTISGLKAQNPQKRLGVIWIDAHADLHTPYTTPSGNLHGMPLAISLDQDNMACKRNVPNKDAMNTWNALKAIGGIRPKVLPEDIILIGLRDYEKEEASLIHELGIKVIKVSQLRKSGTEQIARQCLLHLQACDSIYVSFDVDSLDSSISKGTGTPVPNGLKEREAEDLLARLMQSPKICCFELTEVNPTLDSENVMSEIAFQILHRCVNILAKN